MAQYEEHYQGARFFKCDIQMQTPADTAHWLGDQMGLSGGDRRSAAEAYIRRCYDVGLEVIAITDHNFASKEFIPFLREAIDKLKVDYGYEIILFPGFEVRGPVGKGAHLVCIFEPGASMSAIEARLTQLGLPPDKRFDPSGQPLTVPTANMTFERMLDIVQRDAILPGICVGAHPNNDGVLDSDTVEQWWSQEVLRNENFLCMELPRPRSEYTAKVGSSLIKSILLNADARYARRRSIATVCSSDCKRLCLDAVHQTNYIGFRHTWIKMSRPSIESLRQAFLDHESRIRFGDRRPEEDYCYPKIRSLTVGGAAFLADQKLAFSPNLNTIIGGRGTGKSTIIEYLRVALAQEGAVQGDDSRKNFQKLRRSIRPNTVLSANLEKEDQRLSVESRGEGKPSITAGPSAPDLTRFFPVRILSQREIYAIAEDRNARLRLVDDLVRGELDELGRREQDLLNEIRGLNQQISGLAELIQRQSALETERKDLEVKLSRLKALEEPLARWKGRLAEQRFFQDLPREATAISAAVRESVAATDLQATTIGDELGKGPDAELVARIAVAADGLLEKLRTDVEQAVSAFDTGLRQLLEASDVTAWHARVESERSQFETLRTELQKQGTDPDQYLDYQRALRERTVQLEEVKKRIEGIEDLRRRRDGETSEGHHTPGLINDLHAVWRQQTKCREEAASRLRDGVPNTTKGNPFVNVSVLAFGDEHAFLGYLRGQIRDGRRMSEDDWDKFMCGVFHAAHVPSSEPSSPTEVLSQWVRALRSATVPSGCPWKLNDRLAHVLLEWLTDDRLEELRLWRTPDRVTIGLYRQDGSFVGNLDGEVSVGQRSTAILALVLASGDTPVVIDQPEEDLDNEFVFHELVPLFRQVKERRQIIVTTHNANIPVNADAELVIALQVSSGHGGIMKANGYESIGGLDREAVKLAVENIMEGSEEAFRRRFEKYGF